MFRSNRIPIVFLIVLVLTACIRAPQPPIAPALPRPQSVSPLQDMPLPLAHRVYLPIAGSGIPEIKCFGEKEQKFFDLMVADSRQQREGLRCNPFLNKAAIIRAQSLADGGYWAHCDPVKRECPNKIARLAGCKLPSNYEDDKNYIEELSAGSPDVQVSFDSLANSPSHKVHLFGEGDFFRQQSDVGIALLEQVGSRFIYYWVVLIGICE